jgi:glycosyltransferase involved in cell wall biosynthesis
MKASIIITCHNREKFVSRAIRCAISQRFPRDEFEVVVVDDGSTDHSKEIIRDFGDAVVPIFHDRNRGLPIARNSGIRKAKGRFVLHLDSDDYMHDELLYMSYVHLWMNPDWGAAACDYYVVDTLERNLERRSAEKEPLACGILFRKDLLVQIGLYDPRMRACEDQDLRARFSEKFKIGYITLPLYRYTRHDGNLTNDTGTVEHYRRMLARKQARAAASKSKRGSRSGAGARRSRAGSSS